MELIIKGSEKRISELERFLSTYFKQKGLTCEKRAEKVVKKEEKKVEVEKQPKKQQPKNKK